MTAPRPATEVLSQHQHFAPAMAITGWKVLCPCGATVEDHAAHQADMLAAEGYPTTAEGLVALPEPRTYPTDFVKHVAPGHERAFVAWLAEHDAQVLKDAAAWWQEIADDEDAITVSTERKHAQAIIGRLRDRADRIATGGES